MKSNARLTVVLDAIRHCVDARCYGHFAEHLGRCIYGGIWTDPHGGIANVGGLRSDVVRALRRIRPPVVRWPGGCFADYYHWEDGIGPRASRRRRWNLWWCQPEPNTFGTDEFMAFCHAIGAEPNICLNVGSGSPQEALAWLEYCNADQDTTYARLRARNGHRQPYGVRLWAVGNESYGCGGRFTAESYAAEFRRFACFLRKFPAEKRLELIACGHTAEWNARLLRALEGAHDLWDLLSVHRYVGNRRGEKGSATEFSDEQHYYLMADVSLVEQTLREVTGLLDAGGRALSDKGIALDEWGTWWPEATTPNGLFQQNSLRDALFAARCLHIFHCYPRLRMANIAQMVNVLQALLLTEGRRMVLTPTYHVFNLMQGHQGSHVVETRLECPRLPLSGEESPALSIGATLSSDRRELLLSVTNVLLTAEVQLDIEIAHGATQWQETQILTAADIHAHNTFAHPRAVQPIAASAPTSLRSGWRVHLPPKSLVVLNLAVATQRRRP